MHIHLCFNFIVLPSHLWKLYAVISKKFRSEELWKWFSLLYLKSDWKWFWLESVRWVFCSLSPFSRFHLNVLFNRMWVYLYIIFYITITRVESAAHYICDAAKLYLAYCYIFRRITFSFFFSKAIRDSTAYSTH